MTAERADPWDMALTACPCGCGRRLPVLEQQLSALALADIVDLPEIALQHGLPVWAARHVRDSYAEPVAVPS